MPKMKMRDTQQHREYKASIALSSAAGRKDARIAKSSLACFSPKRKQQSVVLEGIQGQTHPRALGAIKADDHIGPRLRQPTPFS